MICYTGNVTREVNSQVVLLASGVGMLLLNIPIQGNNVIAKAFVLPAIVLSYQDGDALVA